jgi:hypothetical protein
MKFKFLLAASVASLASAAILTTPVAAQQITSQIAGTVTDESGQPIPGAVVIVTDTRTGSARTLTAAASGSFVAPNLVTGGPYTVQANADGFEGQTITDVATSLQGSTNLRFSLSRGGGEIVVSGARVSLSQLAVGPGTSFTAEILESAPSFNRDVRDIIRIDPRVSLDRDDGGSGQDRISCLGGNDRTSQGDIYGLNDTGFSSRSSTPLPYDAVRETQVQFAPFDVDYSAFTGCAINVVTKSGSNDIHGTAFFEYSNSDLRGDTVEGRAVAEIEPDKRWGGSLGLPIIADTLFLFGAYEHQEAGQSQDDGPAGAGFANPLAGVPVAAFDEISAAIKSIYGIDTGQLVTNRPYSNDRYFVRADWQINDRHRLEGTYQRLEESSVRADDFFTGATSPQVVGENTFYLSGTESNYYSGRLYSQWSDALSTELRYSRSEVTDLQDPIGGGEAQSDSPIYRIIVGIDNPGSTPDGAVLAGPGTSRSANDLQTTVNQYRAAATYRADRHTIKFGGEYNQANLFNLFVQNATGTLVFRNIDDLRAGLLSPGLGNNQTSTTPTNIVTGQTEGAFINYTVDGDINTAAAQFEREIFSLFVQDEINVNERLTTVFGLRAEWYAGGEPEYNNNFFRRYGFANTTGFDALGSLVMPRVGATYELDDFAVFGRPTLTGGVGLFSGGDPLVWFGNAFQNDGISFAQGSTQGGTCATGQIDVVVNGQFTGIPTCALANASGSAARGEGFTQAIDPDIQQQSVLRANIGFNTDLNFADSGLFAGWNFSADYIFSRTSNPYTVVDLSQVPHPNRGLSGFAIDGRPVYVTIDPLNPGCSAQLVLTNPTPKFNNVTAACITTSREDELMLTNADAFNSHNASVILSKSFDRGLFTEGGSGFISLGYAWSGAKDRRNMYNSTAGSNYDVTAAFDRQNPAASRGFYSSKHNFSIATSLAETFVSDLETRLGVTFIARSGRPYSLTFTGSGVFNDSASGSDNALVYLPTGINDPNIAPVGTGPTNSNQAAVEQLVAFASGLDCASDYLGQTIERNTCSNDWYFDLDLSFSQEIPGPASLFGANDKLKLFATFDNFLNLLDNDWNVQHRRDFGGRQDVATTAGVDAQGRYIITSAAGINTFESDNGVNTSSSVWRMKVGVSYEF